MHKSLSAPVRAALLVGAALSLPAASAADPQFTRITDGPVVSDAWPGLSGAWGDYDADGDADLYVGSIGSAILYRNDGGDTFSTVAGDPGDLTPDAARTMAAWADYDDDGDLDLYRCTFTFDDAGSPTIPLPNDLFRNDGGTFTRIDAADDSSYTPAASWVDYDGDGDLDLFAAGATGSEDLLYRNDDGAFTRRTGLPFLNSVAGGVLQHWLDYDADGDADLYVVNHGAPNELWRNLLRETGTPESFEADTTSGLTDEGSIIDFGMSWADYDNDGDLDGFLSTLTADRLFRNDGGTFAAVTGIPLVQGSQSSSGGSWGDFDNDGDVDLFVPHAAPTAQTPDLWRNDGGDFVALDPEDVGDLLLNLPRPQVSEWADYDSDGDLDLYVANHINLAGNPRPNRLYRNDGTGNAWLHVRLVGSVSSRSAVGAVIRARAVIGGSPVWQMRTVVAGPTSFEFQRELRQHFGLGDATVVDSLVVEWPSGLVQTLTDVATQQTLTVLEADAVGVPEVPRAGGPELGTVAPNPTDAGARIGFSLDRDGLVDLAIFDLRGRRVRSLVRGFRPAGAAQIGWDGRDGRGRPVISGVYFVRLDAGAGTVTRKLVVVRPG